MNLLEVKNICKTYGNGETAVKALKDVSFSVPKGEYVAIVGESGSGKSTLLNMIGALDTPTSGKVLIDGKDIFCMNDKKLTVFRRRNIGFIMGNTKYGLIGIQLDSNATEETIAEIRSLENDDIIITDQRESNKQNNATYLAVRIVCYGFLAIVGIISLFNIVNSISMSVSARMKQYGAMRAVGMDNRQLKRMISAEAYTYAISGLIVGCGIGLPLSRFLYNRLIAHYFGIEWSFPILRFGIVVAFIFISAIVSVYAPAKRIRNMEITETINEW